MDGGEVAGIIEVVMTDAVQATQIASKISPKRSTLRLHLPTEEVANSARWFINGFPATILVWTADEWARLRERPLDAQQVSNGSWCALRID